MTERWGHRSVLLEEVIDALRPEPGQVFCDLTLGAGGHSARLLEATSPDGRVYGFDRDVDAANIARDRLSEFEDRLTICVAENVEAPARLRELGVAEVAGVLMDLGVSSMQLDSGERGFSIKQDGPLDMRMSKGVGVTAEELINTAGVAELERILREYGEEPRARAIARKIVEVRKRTRIRRTRELAELVRSTAAGGGRIHPATRVFQALRIAVNDELEGLERLLPEIVPFLAPGGRLAVIAFHSLEDRIVKRRFRDLEKEGEGRSLTKRPIQPTDEESRANPRSRSARLRVFEKRR